MTIPMLITLSLSLTALAVSTFALFAARRSSDRSLQKRLQELSMQHSELAETVESQSLAIRNLRSRANAAMARAKRASDAESADQGSNSIDPELAKDDWQREMNLKIATGQVRMPGRR